jgi:molecular chaperone GrpE
MQSSRGIDARGLRDPSAQERSGREDAPAAGEGKLDGGREANSEQQEPTAELARIEDLYKRALADLDNYRKRSRRELDRRTTEVTESMLMDWLEAVDSVERAIRMESDGPCRDGLRAVMGQMDSVLQRQGAQRIGEPGEHFDPERHDAVAMRTSDAAPDQTVLEVQRPGFMLGARVVRPAQVVVARAPENAR